MKAALFILFLSFCYIECRKVYKPIDKNANIDFINMETGGYGRGPAATPVAPAPARPSPVQPAPAPAPKSPTPTLKPVVVTPPVPGPAPAKPQPAQPTPPNQIKPIPVNPTPAAHPITTPGPGSVKHLINFYDSQGKGSPIRPYSYSQAVKQG
ncbi:hypothetical protein O3G_MSEX011019 [Manduca sexta]|uniref:Uncharacterized protein n=1 Tax=Manduca sexta TaxID=7130 RepID=A0A922CUK0_MANSE|nr:hypothetical protein O3G_MSEX011019 [Manduca sexta]